MSEKINLEMGCTPDWNNNSGGAPGLYLTSVLFHVVIIQNQSFVKEQKSFKVAWLGVQSVPFLKQHHGACPHHVRTA